VAGNREPEVTDLPLRDLGLVHPEAAARSKRLRRRVLIGVGAVVGVFVVLAIVGAILGPVRTPSAAMARWTRLYEQPDIRLINRQQSSIDSLLGQWSKGELANLGGFNGVCHQAESDLLAMVVQPVAPVKSVANAWLGFGSVEFQLETYECQLPSTPPNGDTRKLKELEFRDTLPQVAMWTARVNSQLRAQGFNVGGKLSRNP
jgi:hypothetical protein